MLSWSSAADGDEIELSSVASGEGPATLPLAAELAWFATAAVAGNDADRSTARAALADAGGVDVMVDAAAVVANFEMMTRLADGTGARMPDAVQADRAAATEAMGMGSVTSRR